MSLMEFVLFSVMLMASSALPVFSSIARPLLLCKRSKKSLKLTKKKIMVLFIQYHDKREVYCERTVYPAGNYMFKVNNRNTKTRCEICSKFTIKTPERRQWRRSGVSVVTLNIFHTLF